MGVKIHGALLGLVTGLACVVSVNDAYAYERAGHYYSIQLALTDGKVDKRAAAIVSFCAQLPDQSSDLDAVAVYLRTMTHSAFSWLKWAFADSVDSITVRKMVTVQQILHGLTGGDAATVQNTAKAIIMELANAIPPESATNHGSALCALGFAMHLYGDSFAHQQMDRDPQHMYTTGVGHARDYHYPDLPLCDALAPPRSVQHCILGVTQRFKRWSGYLVSVRSTVSSPLSVAGAPQPSWGTDIASRIQLLGAEATDENDWNESAIRKVLSSPVDPKVLEDFFDRNKSSRPCREVVADALATSGPLQGLPSFNCTVAWALFSASALKHYRQAEPGIRQKMDFDPYRTYLDPL